MEQFRSVAPEMKREYGQKLNELKKSVAAKIPSCDVIVPAEGV